MSDLMSLVASQLSSENISSLSQSIGASPDQTQSAIGALLPTMIAGMAERVAQPEGEQQLHRALSRDHDGSILEHLGNLFAPGKSVPEASGINPKTTQGGSILDHIFGGKQSRVEERVGQASGLSSGQVMKLMMMLAPVVMGILGRQRKQEDLSPGGLGDLIRKSDQEVQAQTGAKSGWIARMLDQDGDGDFDMMDMMKLGASRLFKR